MRSIDKHGKPCLVRLTKAMLRRMGAVGLITDSASCPVEEQALFQYFDLHDKLRADGYKRYTTIKCAQAQEGWALVPLHPNYDSLVFGHVSGCFYPVLLDDDYTMPDETIFAGDVCHPEYHHLERCGVVPPNQRG